MDTLYSARPRTANTCQAEKRMIFLALANRRRQPNGKLSTGYAQLADNAAAGVGRLQDTPES